MEIIDQIIDIIQKLPQYLVLINAALTALIALFMVIPGEQPEKFLQQLVDFISKYSKK